MALGTLRRGRRVAPRVVWGCWAAVHASPARSRRAHSLAALARRTDQFSLDLVASSSFTLSHTGSSAVFVTGWKQTLFDDEEIEEEGGEEEEEEEDTAANRDSAGGLKVPLAVGDGTSETYTLLSPNNPTLKVTKKIDIFAAGCVFYYILSGGEHPFGDRYMREMNIVKGNFKVEKCSSGGENDLDEEISESKDLIKRMIAKDPKKR